MKKYLIFIVVFFLVMMVNLYCFAAGSMESDSHKGHHHEAEKEEPFELSGKLENGIRVIEVKASRYKFEPDPIVVKLGEKVRLVGTSTDVTHGIAIAEFKVNLTLPVGKTSSVEFIADNVGTFHMHCSVYCGPDHLKMHGTLKVIE